MTIRVIQQGKLPDEKWVGRCSWCNARIECDKCDKCDVQSGPYDPRDQTSDYYVKCPTGGCGREIYVKPKNSD